MAAKSRRRLVFDAKASKQTIRNARKIHHKIAPYLREGERVLRVVHQPMRRGIKRQDPLNVLARLGGVEKARDLGTNGKPVVAALSLVGRENAAGQGFFQAVFGRDMLYMSLMLLSMFPRLARTAIIYLAERMGMINNLSREEEVGKIMHEERDPKRDKIARWLSRHLGWGWPFFASTDATPLWIILLYKYCKQSKEGFEFLKMKYVGRDGKTHTLFDALQLATRWIIRKMNSSPEGFVEYSPGFPGSHKNQGMEDSGDSHFHADGSMPDFSQGIVSTEIQGLAYDALVYAREMFLDGADSVPSDGAQALRAEAAYVSTMADKIERAINDLLWVEDPNGGYYAAGADRDKLGNLKVMKVLKAIPAFLLNTELHIPEERIQAWIRTLFSPRMLAAGGIRTLATDQPHFAPGAYHNGNVWLFMNFVIAEGFRKRGYPWFGEELDLRIMNAVDTLGYHPEFVWGGGEPEVMVGEWQVVTVRSRGKNRVLNTRMQPPQEEQGWSVTAVTLIEYRARRRLKNLPHVMSWFETDILDDLPLRRVKI